MSGVLIFIFVIGLCALLIFISVKINNLKYRAKQSVLNKVGIGDSNVSSASDKIIEKTILNKFLQNHPSYSEESIKSLIQDIALQIVNRNLSYDAEQEVIDKIPNDSKLDKFNGKEPKRVNLNAYNEKYGLFGGKVVFSDNRDEYELYLRFKLTGDNLKVTKYQIQKGMVVGF